MDSKICFVFHKCFVFLANTSCKMPMFVPRIHNKIASKTFFSRSSEKEIFQDKALDEETIVKYLTKMFSIIDNYT